MKIGYYWPAYLSNNVERDDGNKLIKWKEGSDRNSLEFQKTEKIWTVAGQVSKYNIDVESAWNKVNSKADIRPVSSNKSILRISVAYILRIAAVVVFGLIAWYTTQFFMNEKTFTAGDKLVQLALNDGLQVALNRETQLKYPEKFNGNLREVYLNGEAYFEVAKNPKKPFIIHAADACIMVIGTSFNINSNNNGNVELIVNSGVVVFGKEGLKDKVVLHVNEKAILDAKKAEIFLKIKMQIQIIFHGKLRSLYFVKLNFRKFLACFRKFMESIFM